METFPGKMYLYPEPGVFGKLIHAGELVATVYVNKFSTMGQEAGERNFTGVSMQRMMSISRQVHAGSHRTMSKLTFRPIPEGR